MQRQIWTDQRQSLMASVTNNRISEMRRVAFTTTAVRVYDGDRVGQASTVGHEADLDALTKRATDALAFGIPHPGPARGKSSASPGAIALVDALEFQQQAQGLLDRLTERFPGFLFSNTIACSQSQSTLSGEGTEFAHTQQLFQSVLYVRQSGSPSILDSFAFAVGDTWDEDSLIAQLDDSLAPFTVDVGPPVQGDLPVLFHGLMALDLPFSRSLKARDIHQGISMFRLEHDGFHERFSLVDSRGPHVFARPFDMEGTQRSTPDLPLIQGGRLLRGVADLRDAARIGVDATGNAEASSSDELPTTTVGHLEIEGTVDSVRELLPDGGIEVFLSAGGDCTQTGDYGMPVMVGFHLDGEGKRTTRLPPTMLSGNLFRMFGEDFVGATTGPLMPGSFYNGVVTRMRAN